MLQCWPVFVIFLYAKIQFFFRVIYRQAFKRMDLQIKLGFNVEWCSLKQKKEETSKRMFLL